MSGYKELPVTITFEVLKYSNVGKTTSYACQMMEVSDNTYLLVQLHYLKTRRKWLLNTMSGTWKTHEELELIGDEVNK